MRSPGNWLCVITWVLLGASSASAAPDGGWEWPDEGVGFGGDYVRELLVWNDGSGPALYVGGVFSYAGGQPQVNGIARWDGKDWSKLGSGLSDSAETMVVFDDGSGPALFVGGGFNFAGGAPAKHVAKWDGLKWSPVGDTLTFSPRALAVFDHGDGPELYAGGGGLRKWDGKVWTYLGPPIPTTIHTLAVFSDLTGARLYVGGQYSGSGPYIAAWDGDTLSTMELPPGVFPYANPVTAMVSFDDGSGSKLFVSGRFVVGQTVVGMFRWDGVAWEKSDSGLISNVDYFDFATSGQGPTGKLYVIGPPSAALWDKDHWTPLDPLTGIGGPVLAGALFDDGAGPRLHIGGSIDLNGKWTNIARTVSVGGGTPCGDLTGDGFVNQQDLGLLLGDFGCTKGVGLCPGDCDSDGDTDQADLGILLANWEKPCP